MRYIYFAGGEWMKKIIAVLLGLLAVLFAAQTARAEDKKYYLDEIPMYVDVPHFPWVVTRDVTDGDSSLDYLGCTIEELREMMEDNGYNLIAGSGTGSFMYFVLSSESDHPDFNTLSKTELEQLLEGVRQSCIDSGATWIDGFVYQYNQTKFICMEISETSDGEPICTRQYNTVYNGKYISVGVRVFDSEIYNDSFRTVLENMVDSVWFGEELPPVKESLLTEGEHHIFYLEEPGLEITIPGGFAAFTRDMDPAHPNFAQMGYTWEYAMESMEKGDVYLDALTPNGNLELLVISAEFPAEDLRFLSEIQLQEVLQTRKKQLEEAGAQRISAKVFEHHQAKFLQIDYSGDLGWTTGYAREYYTLYADKIINIALASYHGKLTAEQETVLAGIINNIHFGTEPEENEPAAPAPKYTDDLTGLVISPPNLWMENPISAPNAGLSMQFTFSANTDKKIRIYSRDLFHDKVLEKLIPDFEPETCTRSDAGHELLTAEIVAEFLGCDVAEVFPTRYGGREYFRADIITTIKVGGKQQPVPACALVRIENGYLYMFQYIGATDDGSFLNFRKMVAKAVYPTDLPKETEPVPMPELPLDTKEPDVPSTSVPEENTTVMAGKDILWMVVPVLALAVIGICIFAVSKNKRRRIAGPCDPWEKPEHRVEGSMTRRSVESTKPEVISELSAPEPSGSEPVRDVPDGIVYCRKCGTQLSTTHRFCHKCGTENILFRTEEQK